MLALVLATAVSASPANVYPARLRRSLFADEVRGFFFFCSKKERRETNGEKDQKNIF